MNISGTSIVFVAGRPTRVLSRRFNKALKANPQASFSDEGGNPIVPSKGLTWVNVASLVRSGKTAVASSGAPRKRAVKKTSVTTDEASA